MRADLDSNQVTRQPDIGSVWFELVSLGRSKGEEHRMQEGRNPGLKQAKQKQVNKQAKAVAGASNQDRLANIWLVMHGTT